MHEPLRWNYLVGMGFILLAVVFVFGFGGPHSEGRRAADHEPTQARSSEGGRN